MRHCTFKAWLSCLFVLINTLAAENASSSKIKRSETLHEERRQNGFDEKGRKLSVVYRQAKLSENAIEQLMRPSKMEGIDVGPGELAKAAVPLSQALTSTVHFEVQLMPDSEMMSFFLTEDSENPGVFSGLRNPQNKPVDQETYGEMNVIRHGNGDVTGSASVDGLIYQLGSTEDGEVLVTEIAMDQMPPDNDPLRDHVADEWNGLRARHLEKVLDQHRSLTNETEKVFIDVLVGYTQRALCAVSVAEDREKNGLCEITERRVELMKERINLAISESNIAFQKSGIPGKFRLAHAFLAGVDDVLDVYDENKYAYAQILNHAATPYDGFLEGIHILRERYAADVVSLWVDNAASCGLSYTGYPVAREWAFSIVNWICATGYYNFAHEIMHNLGASHDRVALNCLPTECCKPGCSNYAYHHPNGYFRTIMANGCPENPNCPRVQMFSTPQHKLVVGAGQNEVSFDVGDEYNDNVKQITSMWSKVANYSTPGVILEPIPTTPPKRERPPTAKPSTLGPSPKQVQQESNSPNVYPNFYPSALPSNQPSVLLTNPPSERPTNHPSRFKTASPVTTGQETTASPIESPASTDASDNLGSALISLALELQDLAEELGDHSDALDGLGDELGELGDILGIPLEDQDGIKGQVNSGSGN